MAVKRRCSINKVDLLRPRAAYFMLKLIWGEGGSCTPFLGQAGYLLRSSTRYTLFESTNPSTRLYEHSPQR
jgi:hypothetical protein